MSKLRQPPTIALCYNTERSTLNEQISSQVPPSTVILGAVSHSIQTCLEGGEVESKSPANILLGNLGPETTTKIQPFVWEAPMEEGVRWDDDMERQVINAFPANSNNNSSSGSFYEVFIIYACESSCSILEEFISCVQNLHPHAALVGGICSSGYISIPVGGDIIQDFRMRRTSEDSLSISYLKHLYKYLGGSPSILSTITEKQTLVEYVSNMLQTNPYMLNPNIEDGIFGVALSSCSGSNNSVPIRSVVSRGVKKLTPPDTTLLIKESHLLFRGTNNNHVTLAPNHHIVDSILDKDTDAKWDLMRFLANHGNGSGVDFCGIRRCLNKEDGSTTYEDSYELYSLDLHGIQLKIPVTTTDNTTTNDRSPLQEGRAGEQQNMGSNIDCSLQEAQVDFFALDGQACLDHVETTMKQLKEQTEMANDNVLAAIMFSCAGRGPRPGWLLPKRMADATAFVNAFGGKVPCVGFYAGGEIGPLATAPATDLSTSHQQQAQARNLFQRGKAALQGFTAVFALFIAPKVNLRHVEIDDSPERVNDFIATRLS